jgi:hypothetical protein
VSHYPVRNTAAAERDLFVLLLLEQGSLLEFTERLLQLHPRVHDVGNAAMPITPAGCGTC